MKRLKICIVEDEPMVAEGLCVHLQKMEHEVTGTYPSYNACFSDINQISADLYLIDIRLRGEKTGIDIAERLFKEKDSAFLFVTSNTDTEMVRKAMATFPVGYITKPYTYQDLFIGIELARAKINLAKKKVRKIELKNGSVKEWVPIDQLLFVEADRSYIELHLEAGSRVVRQSLGNFMENFREDEMIRVHRSFAVNPAKVESISLSKIIIGDQRIPLAPGKRAHMLDVLRSLQG